MKRHPHWLGMTLEEARRIAATPTPKPEAGEWMLVSPSGHVYVGENPIRCVSAESKQRIPAEVALARIRVGLEDEDGKTD